jgi:multiple sugar transport system permease protein
MNKEMSLRQKITSNIALIIVGTTFLIPFILMISMSLASDSTNVQGVFSVIPKEFTWGNYQRVFTGDHPFTRYILNSLNFVFWCIVGQVVVSSLVAYGFARLRSRYKKYIFGILLGTMMLPGAVFIIPQFILFAKLGWNNTYLPLIVPNFCGGAYNIFLIRQFFMSIPTTLDDAAKIDGLGYIGIYVRILVPIIKPILIAIALFTFNYNWGWFQGPLIFIQDQDKFPLALALQYISANQGNAVPNWHLIMVGAVILTLPPLALYFLGQKYILEANISGGSAALK